MYKPTRRTLLWVSLFSLALLPFLVIGWSWNTASRQLESQLAALRAQGLPTSAAENNTYYRIPAGAPDRTADWVTSIRSLIAASAQQTTDALPEIGTTRTSPIPPPGVPWVDFEASRQFLKSVEPELQLIRTAASQPGRVRFPVDCSLGPLALTLYRMQEIRHVARVFVLDSYVSAHEGKHSRIIENIRSINALSDTLQDEPFLMSFSLRLAIEAVSLVEIEKWLSCCDWDDADLASLQSVLVDCQAEAEIVRCLNGERANGLTEFKKLPVGPFRPSVEMEYIRTIDDAIQAFSVPWPQPLKQLAAITVRLNQLGAQPLSRLRYSDVPTFGPTLEQAGRNVARRVAKQRCMCLLIAAQRHRLQHGQLPASLSQIDTALRGPAGASEFLLIDPFDGQPLCFRSDDAGIIIYSVSENRIDDGGEIPSESTRVRDVGFRLLKDKSVHDPFEMQ